MATAPSANAAFPGENGQIAWSASLFGEYDLWTMAPDGSSQQPLVTEPLDERQVTFSADGARIAYSRPVPGAGYDIFTADADGTNEHRVTDSAGDDMHPSFSPDGKKIAYSSTVTGDVSLGDIYSIGADGSGPPTRLSRGDGDDREPAWSPDGERIAFSRRDAQDGGDPGDIIVMNAGGVDVTPTVALSDETTGQVGVEDRHPEWTPDAEAVVWSRRGGGEVGGLYIQGCVLHEEDLCRGPDPSSVRPRERLGAFGGALEPAVSPDGRQLLYRVSGPSFGQNRIYLQPIDGQAEVSARVITRDPPGIRGSHVEPAWQPRSEDRDGDGIPDSGDNCPSDSNSDQADQDTDGAGDVCDGDVDGDEVPNDADNCVDVSNPDQTDADGDGEGDRCDPDRDGDAVSNTVDNCPDAPNGDQSDGDGDGKGDGCDQDRDGDSVENSADNCPDTPNEGQADADADGIGDACDADRDGDGVPDESDNCPTTDNPAQDDQDADGTGDACDSDRDGDGHPNESDNCPTDANEDQGDWDGDGNGDACDPDKPPAQQLTELGGAVAELDLPRGTETSLRHKVDNALTDYNARKLDSACGKLQSFVHELRALAGKKVSEGAADGLTARAQGIQRTIGCDD